MSKPWDIQRHRKYLALVIQRDGKRCRYSLGTNDLAEAERRAPAIYAEVTKPRNVTVAELWRAYLEDRSGRAIVPTMRHTFKALRDRFGALPADEITIAHCRAHTADRRAKGIKDGTIHTELGHLRMVLKWAEHHRYIAHAPRIERPTKPEPSDKHLTMDQMERLLEATTLPHMRLFIILAHATAGRAAAVLGLTWDRVDFEHNVIVLADPALKAPHKGRATVPMSDTLRAALQDAKGGALSPYVIEWAGKRVVSVKKGLTNASTRAGLPKVTAHMLRHSAAVHMAEAGTPMDEIASYLGHSQMNVTRKVYARFSPNSLRKAAGALELTFLKPGHASRRRA